MRPLRLLALGLLALPLVASASIATPWSATSTDRGSISPNAVNGNNPFLKILSVSTSTFSNGINLTSGCFSIGGVCIGSGGSGTVSQINTTYPLLGGPITTTGTLSLAFSTTTIINAGTGISTSSTAGGAITVTNTSPLTGLTAAFPFSFDGAHTLTWSGLATTAPGITAGQPLYATGARTIASVASSTFLTSIGGQASGNYITALTGDVTASGPGSVAATLATVNSNVGTFTYPSVTVNGKGLITSISNGSAPTTYTGSYPISVSGSAISFLGLATTSTWTAGQLATVINGNTVAGVSTSTLTATSPLTGSFTQIGSGGSLGLGTVGVANGGTGSTTLSGILAGNGTSAVKTVVIGSNLTFDGTTLAATGGGSSFGYPFPSNATTTALAFNNGLSISGATSQLHSELDVDNNTNLTFLGGASGCTNTSTLKTGTDGTFLYDLGCAMKVKVASGNTFSLTDGSFNNWMTFDGTNQSFSITTNNASTIKYASTTALSAATAIYDTALGTAAGAFVAVDPSGKLIATTTPSGGSGTVGSGTTGQFPYYAGSGTTLTATSSIFLATSGNVGIGTTSPYAKLSVAGTVVGQNFVATSTTATSTFAGDLVIGANGNVLPNPYLFIGTSTAAVPLYGRVKGDLVDAEYDWNGQSSINVANANTGSCASATFFADGNNPTLGGYYGTFSFLNDGWTGSGCSIGAGTAQKPEAVVLANPTGEMDFVIASTTNNGSADFNWFSNTNTPLMKLTNGGNLGVGTTSPYKPFSVGGDAVIGAPTAGGTLGSLFLPKLGTAAGSFIAVNAIGQVIATTAPSGSGSVTSIATGQGLHGGPITTTGTLTTDLSATLTVSTTSTAGEYTDVQAAINALPSTGGLIHVTCGTYTLPSGNVGIQPKVANTIIEGEGNCTQFNFDKANTTNAYEPAASNLTGLALRRVYIHQTNATFGGIGINASNTPLFIADTIKIDGTATSTSIKDTKNLSFYQTWQNLDLRDNTSCVDIGGNPVNDNYFGNIRCAMHSGNNGFALFMTSGSVNGAQNNSFVNFNSEPTGAGTGLTAIFAANAVDNTFINPYIEGNATGYTFGSNSQRNTVYGGQFLTNTTYTNSGSNNQFIGVDQESVALNQIMASSTIQEVTGNDATVNDLSFRGNGNFAKTGSAISIVYNNGTDSGIPLQITNPGTGTSTQIVDTGTGMALEVDDQANDTTPFVITAAGAVGIGSSTPFGTALGSNGTVFMKGLTTSATGNGVCITTGNQITNAGAAGCTPSTRLAKHDISGITDEQAAEVLRLKPVQYRTNDTNEHRFGFIAEDASAIDPSLVQYATADTQVPAQGGGVNIVKKGQPLTFDYERYTGLLTAEVQKQAQEIAALGGSAPVRSAEENWQWAAIALLGFYVVYNEVDKRRRT